MAHSSDRLQCLAKPRLRCTIVAALALTSIQFADRQVATAAEVSRLLRLTAIVQKSLTADGAMNGEEFSNFKRTQVAMLKSRFVLQAALRKPEIAKLPIVAAQADPVAWLESQLVVDFPGDAELLRVGMKGDKSDQLAKLVNAVVDSYMNEVVYAERDEQLRGRENLQMATGKYREEIRRKFENLQKMQDQTGTDGRGRSVAKKVAMRQLEFHLDRCDRFQRLLDEIELQLIDATVAGEPASQPALRASLENKRKLLEKRLAQLNEETKAKMAKVRQLDHVSVDVVQGKAELDMLQEITRRMESELRQWDLGMDLPPRVREMGSAAP